VYGFIGFKVPMAPRAESGGEALQGTARGVTDGLQGDEDRDRTG
jgi:hypothetical protein